MTCPQPPLPAPRTCAPAAHAHSRRVRMSACSEAYIACTPWIRSPKEQFYEPHMHMHMHMPPLPIPPPRLPAPGQVKLQRGLARRGAATTTACGGRAGARKRRRDRLAGSAWRQPVRHLLHAAAGVRRARHAASRVGYVLGSRSWAQASGVSDVTATRHPHRVGLRVGQDAPDSQASRRGRCTARRRRERCARLRWGTALAASVGCTAWAGGSFGGV